MSEADPQDLDGLVARVDPDRWLSSRFVGDAQARADLIALYAFDHELARAPKVATNPLVGEIRLTWWREVLDETFEGQPIRHHPTAEALGEMVRRHGLARAPLEALIDARYRELDPRPMTLDEALAWATETGGRCARIAATILDPSADGARAEAGGKAWAIGRLMSTAGFSGPDADRVLTQSLDAARGLAAEAFPAIAHATLARLYAAGKRPSALGARLRIIRAVLTGRV